MRAEQKIVREWADEQAQQQQDIAAVLKSISDKKDTKPQTSPKSGPKGKSR